jgi:hypothetical protein
VSAGKRGKVTGDASGRGRGRGRGARPAAIGVAALATVACSAGAASPSGAPAASAASAAGASSAAIRPAASGALRTERAPPVARTSDPLSVLVELDPGVDEQRWRETQLQPLGGEVRGRLRHVRDALIVQVPAASLEPLRRLPGVRRVTIVRDAHTGPPPPVR